MDSDGNAIAGVASQPVDANGGVNLSTLALTSTLPQFLITLTDLTGTLGQVVVTLTWEGHLRNHPPRPHHSAAT